MNNTKALTDVDISASVDNIFVNDSGKVRQVSKATLFKTLESAEDYQALKSEVNTLQESVNGIDTTTDTTLTKTGKAADAKITGDKLAALKEKDDAVDSEIGSLKEDLDNAFEKSYGKNLFNKNALKTGYWWNNGEKVNKNYAYFKTSLLKANKTYVLSGQNAHIFIASYGAGKQISLQEIMIKSPVFTIPDGTTVVYISTAITSGQTNTTQIEEGSTATDYEEYNESTDIKSKRLDDVEKKVNVITGGYTINVKLDGTGDFNKVSEAVASAKNNDHILVFPGIYADEIIECWGKTIFIEGISKKNCIIKNKNCNYQTPPIEFSSGGLRNLAFVAEYDSNNFDSKITPSYAMHIEDNYMQGKSSIIENCYFESQLNFGVGMGMRPDCNIQFLNCEMVGSCGVYRENEVTYAKGGLFFHDSNTSGLVGLHKASFDNCLILTRENGTHEYQSIDLNIQSQEKEGSNVDVRFTNCCVKNIDKNTTSINMRNDAQGTTVSNFNDLTNFYLNYASFGNNVDKLNS